MSYVGQKSTVLVVDDFPPARDAVRLALKAEFNCLSADSGKQALEILKANPVDAVVLDIRMPEMDGIEVLRRIKEMGIQTQVILLTGYGSLDTAQKAVRYGAFDYLIKPFDVPSLREVVSEAIERKHLLQKDGKDGELDELARSLTAKLSQACRLARTAELSSEALREMKSPLTAIHGYAELLLKKLKERRFRMSGSKSLRYISAIEEEAQRCIEIASRLVSPSTEKLNQDGTVLNEALLDVGAMLRPQCSMRGIDLVLTPPQEEVVVDASSDDLHVILVNVLLNAIEAIEGPGEIGVKSYRIQKDNLLQHMVSDSEEEFLQQAADSDLAAIEVSDTGRGIDPEHLQKVFDVFFTTKEEESGAGLGLTICKEKVERGGGHVEVVGSSPKGTTIRILLPVTSDE